MNADADMRNEMGEDATTARRRRFPLGMSAALGAAYAIPLPAPLREARAEPRDGRRSSPSGGPDPWHGRGPDRRGSRDDGRDPWYGRGPRDGHDSHNDGRFVRRTEILLEQGQGGFFLTHAEGDVIFALNNIGWVVWELLAEPLGEAEAVALLASVFPETPRGEIERDVANLFADLLERRLVRPAEAESAPT